MELLIVIVVIAILAAISVVAYNGIQTRAKNTKTINAAAAWIKAIKLYEAEKGSWPTANSCLGSTTTYQSAGGNCWNGGWTVSPTFISQVQPYLNGTPEPDTTDISTANSPRGGALYNIDAGNRYIYITQVNVSTCPDLGLPNTGGGNEANGRFCIYRLNN